MGKSTVVEDRANVQLCVSGVVSGAQTISGPAMLGSRILIWSGTKSRASLKQRSRFIMCAMINQKAPASFLFSAPAARRSQAIINRKHRVDSHRRLPRIFQRGNHVARRVFGKNRTHLGCGLYSGSTCQDTFSGSYSLTTSAKPMTVRTNLVERSASASSPA
jgi:hypothetical protein